MNEFIYILRHVLIYQNTPDAIYAQSSSNFQTSKDQGDCQEASGTHALAINDCISTSVGHAAYSTVLCVEGTQAVFLWAVLSVYLIHFL